MDNSGSQDNSQPPTPPPAGGTPPTPPPAGGTPTPPPAGGTTPPPPAGGTPPPTPPAGGTPPPPPPAGGTTPPPPAGGTPPPPPPAGGTPTPGMPPAGGAATPPPEDTTPANFQLGLLFTEGIKLGVPEHPETKFDDKNFITLLAGSISLSKAEKKRIVDAIPKLKQWQVDELINIFEEERKKFAQLSQKHVPQLEKLAKQHFEEWQDLEMMQQQEGRKEEDTAKADEIKKKLGL